MTNLARKYGVKAAANLLGVSESTLRQMIARKQISFVRIGVGRGRIFLTDEHIAEYNKRNTHRAVA